MNIDKIRRLSKVHGNLKKFHKMCTHNDVELTAKFGCQLLKETLGSSDTQRIIGAVRKAVLLEMGKLEEDIKKEVTE